MSHNVETMAYANQTPWHGLGVNVSPDLTPMEMLKAAGLDWKVKKVPVQNIITTEDGETIMNTIDDQYSLIRETDHKHLSIVGRNYVPIQNEDAMQFFHDFVQAGHMKMETAGSLSGGRTIWALANLDQSFTLAGGDKVRGFLLLNQPHIIGKGMQLRFTPIRVVCNNTLTYALNSKQSVTDANEATGEFRMAHTRHFDEATKKMAENALGISKSMMSDFEEQASFLSSKKCDEEVASNIIYGLFDKRSESEKKDVKEPRIVKKILNAIDTQPGAELESSAGTMWGLFNAITYVIDHKTGNDRDTALSNAWFGPRSLIKHRALEAITNEARAA